jgi:dTDP-4-amino-4,6-dideoxygalactose transaminase
MKVPYSYLGDQFADFDSYVEDLRGLVASGEFTLGPYVEKFEKKFAEFVGVKHAIGTNNGTDALILALKAVGVRPGDEVITVANTFIATVGAIVAAGARPVFVDCDPRMQMDVSKLRAAITPRTRAVLPVHWTGAPADVEGVIKVARDFDLPVVEDACPAVGASINGRHVGTFGKVNAFSMHPLKPLNVWGDGGIVVTNDDKAAAWLRLYRNHGLKDRDHIEFWGVNNRLQPIQALVATRLLDRIPEVIEKRNTNLRRLDEGLASLRSFVKTPERPAGFREAVQLYVARVARRDELLPYLQERGIEARVHYPIPLHLQKAAAGLGYRKGDFPECERQAAEIITLPSHQYITAEQVDYTVQTMREFYQIK